MGSLVWQHLSLPLPLLLWVCGVNGAHHRPLWTAALFTFFVRGKEGERASEEEGRKEGRSDCGLGAQSIEGGHRQLTQDVVVEACCVITNQRDLCSPSEDPSGDVDARRMSSAF